MVLPFYGFIVETQLCKCNLKQRMSRRCGCKVRGSAAYSSSLVHEGKRGREGVGVMGGLWGMCLEHLHVKRGERIGNDVLCVWKMLCYENCT